MHKSYKICVIRALILVPINVCVKKKQFQSVLVDCQLGIGRTLRVKLLTWGQTFDMGSNFWPGIKLFDQGSNFWPGVMGQILGGSEFGSWHKPIESILKGHFYFQYIVLKRSHGKHFSFLNIGGRKSSCMVWNVEAMAPFKQPSPAFFTYPLLPLNKESLCNSRPQGRYRQWLWVIWN